MSTDAPHSWSPRMILGVVLGALIWLWPYTGGPLSQFWPNLVAWSAGLVLVGVVLKRADDGEAVVASGWLMAAAVSALLAVAQYFDLDDALFPFSATALPGHAYANTRQPNHLATLLTVGMLTLVWMVHRGRWRRHALWLGGLMAVALAATASRGGAVQLLLVGLLAAAWGGENRRRLLAGFALVALIYVAAVLSLPKLLALFQGVQEGRNLLERMAVESSCSSRKVLWSNVLDLIAQRPWTGWGWGELKYAHYMYEAKGPRFCDMLSNAHNLPLHLAVELGVPVAVVLTLGMAAAVLWLKPWRERDPGAQLAWGALLLVGFHCMLEYPVWFANFQTMVALSVWLLWPGVSRTLGMARATEGLEGTGRRAAQAAVIGVHLLFVAMVWDYIRVTQLFLPYADRLSMYRDDTLAKVRKSVFFTDQVLFAQVVAAQPAPDNATMLLKAASEVLHVSPEPRVIERVIVSASLLGRPDIVDLHVKRYAAAWPKAYATWRAAQR